MAVPGAVPTVTRDFIGLANPAGRKHNRFGAEKVKPPALAIIAKRAADPIILLEQGENADLHVHIDSAMDAVILQGADHFQTGAISDMGEPWIFVATEISLEYPA